MLYVNGSEIQYKTSADRVFIFEHVSLAEGMNEIRAVATENNAKYVDIAKFNKVEEPNPSYEAPVEEKGGEVTNWFQMPDLDGEIEELQFTDDVYSSRCTFKELFENKDAEAVLNKYLGESFRERPTYGMTQGFKIDTLAEMAPEHFTEKLLYALNRELIKIKKNK